MISQKILLDNGVVSAEVALLPGDKLLVTDLQEKASSGFNSTEGIKALFKVVESVSHRRIFVDLKNIRRLTSFSWGTIFTSVEELNLKEIWFFNVGEAILEAAKQMGISENQTEGIRSKIVVLIHDNNAEVLQILSDYKKYDQSYVTQ